MGISGEENPCPCRVCPQGLRAGGERLAAANRARAGWVSPGDSSHIPCRTKWELVGDRDLEVHRWGHQGQAGCGSGQPGLLVGDLHTAGVGTDERCAPLQPRTF